ncbi:hypothetical protein DPMN_051367 [Dreissena polymorpha]|uniref:Uncharacterized protein n=1 Tax=Dreissena polymorpha TaxID=45954 RepID=A0A9D4CHQ7_DREPO|nr:hypothetical protein DPMN_051367 [Dreissena polymorpha]
MPKKSIYLSTLYFVNQKLQGKPGATSETGGWCKQTSKEDSGEHKTDEKLVPVLIDFFQGKEQHKILHNLKSASKFIAQ